MHSMAQENDTYIVPVFEDIFDTSKNKTQK